MSLPNTLTPLLTPLDWLSFPTRILPQWRQVLEFTGGIFGLKIAQNYFDDEHFGDARNILPTMPELLPPFDLNIHGNNEGNRSNRKLAESNYVFATQHATTVLTAERNFRAGIIAAIEPHQLYAAMELTPTGATFPTPAIAVHSIPAHHIIPALLRLALSNGQHLLKSVIDQLQLPFTCTTVDCADKFVFNFQNLSRILSSNGQTIASFQLRDYFIDATTANFSDLLSPFYAIAASKPSATIDAYIQAFLSAKIALHAWLAVQSHAPTALSATLAKPTKPSRPHYCWTHGHGFHSGDKCKSNDITKHKPEATAKNTMGGSTRIAVINPDWKPKPK